MGVSCRVEGRPGRGRLDAKLCAPESGKLPASTRWEERKRDRGGVSVSGGTAATNEEGGEAGQEDVSPSRPTTSAVLFSRLYRCPREGMGPGLELLLLWSSLRYLWTNLGSSLATPGTCLPPALHTPRHQAPRSPLPACIFFSRPPQRLTFGCLGHLCGLFGAIPAAGVSGAVWIRSL